MNIPPIKPLSFDGAPSLSGMPRVAPLAPQKLTPEGGPAAAGTADIGGAFGKALSEARALDKDATAKSEGFANNDPEVGIHEVVIAAEKASISLKYATTLKNKAIEAYHELMQTQV